MGTARDDFDAVRDESDPATQGRLATELLGVYQQRSVELARLRREAMRRLQDEQGLSYAEVAEAFGLSKGRIGQIRHNSPPPERGIFGVGPVTVAVPLRRSAGRELPVLAAEDATAAEHMTTALDGLAFQVHQFRIPPDGQWELAGDTVAICGPKSSPVIDELLRNDPYLSFRPDRHRRWHLTDRQTGVKHYSPMDDSGESQRDIAYVGKHLIGGHTIVVVAGVHAIGSVGAIDHLVHHLDEIHQATGDRPFSFATIATVQGDVVKRTELLCPIRTR